MSSLKQIVLNTQAYQHSMQTIHLNGGHQISNLKITMRFSIGVVSVFLFSFYWIIDLTASILF